MSGLDPKDTRLPGMRVWMAGLSIRFIIRVTITRFVNSQHHSESIKYPLTVHGEDWQDCYNQAERFRDAILKRNHASKQGQASIEVETLA